ncbi:CxxH/CxxC protein [Salsuginibacillus kocurii]|uniref:CxxH/CxxC protein n=1 Tax=Salsuginibacillus kocurii TaxID=427078 RepID=UPI0003677372|nr:CxxH/CxxC protein [Salsuginibacillus kocurii]
MIYCCKTHVEQGLDDIVDKHEAVPIFENVPEEKELLLCEYCTNTAEYKISAG